MAFYLAGAGAVFFSALMLFQPGLYAAAACLLAALLQAAVLLYLAGSPLVSFLQVVICSGGVMALVVVAVMSTGRDDDRAGGPAKRVGEEVVEGRQTEDHAMWAVFAASRPVAAGTVLLLGVEVLLACLAGGSPGVVGGTGSLDSRLGAVLFGPYAVATEAVALLLFLAALALVSGPERGAK
ncbi:MAG: NADH-quinone oxidoreductase subunit J [Elusimicrobia bacterium]|nr:NADH-quinone oxidoreductase subunit J [Elusimicrobiota bacterium]